MPWTPSDAPDPHEILTSAVEDTRAEEYVDALAKFLWFHHNALSHDAALSGVRLSFALAYWLQLAKVYPPARAAFLRTRDEAEAGFAASPSSFNLFHDLAALNRELGDGLRTADAFAAVARRDHATAKRLYHVAEPYLVAAGRYEECNPFLDAPERMRRAAEFYRTMKCWEDGEPPGEHRPPPLARSIFERDVGTLVALLALNGRGAEAGRACAEALAVLDEEEFRQLLGAAASGHLPQPIG